METAKNVACRELRDKYTKREEKYSHVFYEKSGGWWDEHRENCDV